MEGTSKRPNTLRWIGGAALAAALILGGVAAQGALAQTPATTPNTQTGSGTQTTPGFDELRGPRGGPRGDGPRGGGHHGPAALVEATAEVTGLTVEQVRTELQAGKSPAQIAGEHGKTAADVVNAAVAKLKTALDAKVAAGTLTQAQADERLAQATAQLNERVNQTGLPAGGPGKGGPGGPGGRMHLVEATAEVTGLTVEQVRTELQAGKSLAQVASEHRKSADDIIANLRASGEERLDELLERAREQLNLAGGN